MASTSDIHLLVQGSDKSRYEKAGVRTSGELTESAAEEILNLFVLVSPLHLPDVAGVVKAANRKKHLRGLFVEQGRDPHWATTMLDRADLRTLRNTLVHSNPEVFQRVLQAWQMGAQDQLIADATIQENMLFVRTCSLETVEIQLEAIKALKNAARKALLDFEVSIEGAYIHWPRLDVHINMETIRVARDPALREEYQRERLEDDRQTGLAIKGLRKKAGLRQSDISGVSARQVRRIEGGEARARTETLEHFARAHELSLNDYLNEISEAMNRA